MTTKLFNFKARWLLVPLVLLTLGSGNAWGAETLTTTCKGTGSGYGTRRTTTYDGIGWVLASGQDGFLGTGNATSHGNTKPTAADLPVVKAQYGSAATTTTGYYYYYTSTAIANVTKIEITYTAKKGSATVNAYVVSSSTAASSGSATWSKPTLASGTGLSAQGTNIASAAGTYTFKLNAKETSSKYYGVILYTSSYSRLTDGAIKIYTDAPSEYNVVLSRNGATETINNVATGTALDDIDGTGAQGGCSAWTFIGWSKTQRAAQDNTDAMTLVTEVDGAGPYYAVYRHTDTSSGTSYESVSASEVTAGTYVIAALKSTTASSTYYAATGSVDGSNDMTVESTGFTLTNGAFTTLPTGGAEFTFTGNNTDGFTISNGSGNLYTTNVSTSRKLAFQANNSTTWKVYDFTNPLNTNGIYLQYYSGSTYYTITENSTGSSPIRGYTGTTKYRAIYLFKKSTGTNYYSTTATCCTELATINGSVSSTTQNSATLQWDKLSNVDGTTPYTVSCKVTSSGSAAGSVGSIDLSGAKATCTITSLTGGIGYTFTITAHGASGYCDKEQVLTATTPTCTDWSTPTVTYSSSLAINASEGVTIGSGTTHGAVTYESSDEDVLTVDTDGTIHAVGAVTAHIIATWAGETISSTTYCEKSANSNDVTVSGIQVTGTTPVNFGQVYQNAVVADKTIAVTGLGLASAITPSLPAGSPFSFSPASLAKDCSGATLTISASTATLGTYNQTLTLTSGAFSATVTIKMEVIAKPTATFTDALHELTTDKNGASLNSFNLEAAQGTPVVFPTLANQTKSAGTCEGEYYIFAGWTEGDNNTDPEAHLVTSYTLANGDAKHYYAVWADASGSATYTKLTTNAVNTSKNYVIGAESGGDTYYLYEYRTKWGGVSTSEDPIVFTVSGTASALKIKDGSNNYIEPCSSKTFTTTTTAVEVALDDDGTIHNTGTYSAWNLRFNPSAGTQGLRWYDNTTTGVSAYLYEVGAAGTVHYRTSCCANKVDAPVVTATAVTSTSITLTWPADVKATGWEVSWNGGAFGAPSGTCTHTVSGLTPNTTYTWKVRATYSTPQCGADTRSGSTTTNQVYHVTYAKGSGTGSCTASGSTTDETGYEAGATVTLQTNGFTLSGNTFAAWTTDDPDVVISSNQFTMPDHDVVITASWTAKMDKYFDRMHDQTDALHGGVVETEGTNEGKYYIPKEGCNYSIPTAVDSNTGDACQTSHYKLQGWIAASYMKGYPNNMTGEIGTGNEVHIFPPTGTKTATGATYYAIWAEVTE